MSREGRRTGRAKVPARSQQQSSNFRPSLFDVQIFEAAARALRCSTSSLRRPSVRPSVREGWVILSPPLLYLLAAWTGRIGRGRRASREPSM